MLAIILTIILTIIFTACKIDTPQSFQLLRLFVRSKTMATRIEISQLNADRAELGEKTWCIIKYCRIYFIRSITRE